MRRILPLSETRPKPDTSLFIVNVVLLLILFFLAAGQMLNAPTPDIDLSETAELPIEALPKPLLVVDDNGLTLDGQSLPTDDLATALAGATRLHLLIARDRPASDLVALLSRPEFAGIELQLVTLHLPEKAAAP